MSMKKHKSHARHVFNFLEKTYGITLQFGEEESKSKPKKGERKSVGTKNPNQRGAPLIEETQEVYGKGGNEFLKKSGSGNRTRKQTQDTHGTPDIIGEESKDQ